MPRRCTEGVLESSRLRSVHCWCIFTWWVLIVISGGYLLAQEALPSTLEDQRPALDLATYEQQLGVVIDALRSQDWDVARSEAEALAGRRLAVDGRDSDDGAGGGLLVDRSVLAQVESTHSPRLARPVLERLEVLRQELAAFSQSSPKPTRSTSEVHASVDAELLRQIDEEQRVEALRAEGRLPDVDLPDPVLSNRFTAWLGEALVWTGEKLDKLVEWLLDQWKVKTEKEGSSARLDARLVTFMVILLVLLIGWLAFRWLQRGRGANVQTVASSETLSSHGIGDDNPLSREGDEWERYAVRLATDGRLREAIRAWYHAVLVYLYRDGLLHYRKGRTNWEYVAALPSRLRWRPRFIELTRHFEHEWYGRGASSEDAYERCRLAAGEILAQLRNVEAA